MVPHLREYFTENRDLWGILTEYFEQDQEATEAILEVRRLLDEPGDIEKIKQETHHYLLTLFSKIPTRGFLLSPLHDLWRESRPLERPVAFLVHVENNPADGMPSYRAWTLQSGHEDWKPYRPDEGWCVQEGISVLTLDNFSNGRLTKLSSFFQEKLYPCFSHKHFPPQEGQNATEQGHRVDRVFGYLILPLYIFRDEPTIRAPLCAGNLAGTLVVHLCVEDETLPVDDKRTALSLSAEGVIKSLKYVWPAADILIQQVIDSEARRGVSQANHNGKANGLEDAFDLSLDRSLGWKAKYWGEGKELLGNRPVLFDETRGCLLDLNWDWPKNKPSANRVLTITQPVLCDEWSSLGTLQSVVEAQTFRMSQSIYRSVFTQWHAERHIRSGMPDKLREWMDATRYWFAEPNDMKHTFDNVNRDAHKKIVQDVFSFFPDSWWSQEHAQNGGFDSADLLHRALKSLFGADSMVFPERNDHGSNTNELTVGGLFLLFLLAVHEIDENIFKQIVPKNLSFEQWGTPVIRPVPKEAANDLYSRLFSLFQEIVSEKPKGKSIAIEATSKGIRIHLGWGDGGDEFFRRYPVRAAEMLKHLGYARVMDNCMVLALVGSAARKQVFAPWPLFRIRRDQDKVTLILGGE